MSLRKNVCRMPRHSECSYESTKASGVMGPSQKEVPGGYLLGVSDLNLTECSEIWYKLMFRVLKKDLLFWSNVNFAEKCDSKRNGVPSLCLFSLCSPLQSLSP